jgi:hypothetical protein
MDLVPIRKIAEELDIGKNYALRLVSRRSAALGLKPHRGRRNALFLSREDVDRLAKDYRPRLSRTGPSPDSVRMVLLLFTPYM